MSHYFRGRSWKHTACFQLLLCFLSGLVHPLMAEEFTVNESSDLNDLEPGNGLCVAGLLIFPPFVFPLCTVRAAIEESNALPGSDTINIPEGNFLLSINGPDEDMAFKGDLDITDHLIIRGKGTAKTIVDGNGLDRVFDVPNGNVDVTIKHLTITNGTLPPQMPDDRKGGGGIRNRGNLLLSSVVLMNNLVRGSAAGDAGGGLFNSANCVLVNSTVSGNHGAAGGAIHNAPGGALSISASTISGNDAFAGGGISNDGQAWLINATVSGNQVSAGQYPYGGGIYNTAQLEILQSTITANTSPVQGGGIFNEGSISLVNTIVAGNSRTNCYLDLPVSSLGNNLEDGDSCMLDAGKSDLINTDPKLDPLQDHGGPTLTHGLLIGSPAVDRGQNLAPLGLTRDQRGVLRPDGDAYDIGAFETRKRSIVPVISPLLCCGN